MVQVKKIEKKTAKKETKTKTAKVAQKTVTKTVKPVAKEANRSKTGASRAQKAIRDPRPAKIEKIAKVEVEQNKPVGKSDKKPTKTAAGKDTGSVEFQIDNFTKKITSLAKHLKAHPHDFDSRRGLLIMVGKRRRLLNYVKKTDPERYEKLSKSLKLKT